MLAALTLQQEEDALNRLRVDAAFVLHLRQEGPGAVLRPLCAASQEWRQRQTAGETGKPLRVVVFGLLLAELTARTQTLMTDEPAMAAAVKAGLVTEQRFNYMRWNAQTKKLEVDPSIPSIPIPNTLQTLQAIAELNTPANITKFSAGRKMREAPDEGDVATFTVEVAIRDSGAQTLHSHLAQLADNAIFSLVGAQLRKPGLRRYGLANALQKAVYEDRAG
jgi:hypothetical protein